MEGVHIRGIADALRAEGIAVDILSLPGADPYASPKAMSPTRQATFLMRIVSRLPEPLFELAELAYNAVAGWRVLAYVRSHPDLDLIYERYSLFMFAPVLVARLRRVPIVLEINDSTTVERVRPLAFLRLARAIERMTLRRANGLVFVSSIFRDRIVAAHGHVAPTIVSPNAANIDKFSFTPQQREAARQRWHLNGAVVCGYLGAFVPWHAIDRFVYSIAEKLYQAPRLKLLLVGDGATFGDVRKFVDDRNLRERIVLTGRVAHDDVPGLLAAMDLAVLPSAGDYTSPVKLFEFMACGIPPIAPDFAPVLEVLKIGQTGWTFKAADIDAAVDAVLERSRDEASLLQVGRAARAYVKAERQWRNNILQLLEFVDSLAHRSPA